MHRLTSASLLWANESEPGSILNCLGDELEELDFEVSAPLLDAFLARIEAARTEVLGVQDPPAIRKPRGRLLVHRFDRTLETGESQISSRHFFDVRDRPPISLWLETLTRAVARDEGVFEVAVLAFVPESCRLRAEAGRAVCPNGSLFFLDEVHGALSNQVYGLVDDIG